jgi:hypothetical protein
MAESPDSVAAAAGLSTEIIRTAVERRLRSAGIPLTNRGKGTAELYVNVNLVLIQACPAYAGTVALELQQDALLLRDQTIFVPLAGTWNMSAVISAREDRIVGQVIYALEQEADSFVRDYLEMNPHR